MDKSTYETYEYLPANPESESDEFFVVQDDGTFLINRQVQYVAQVQNVKELTPGIPGAQPCAVYDVTAQQFFVDVDNSTEMITVPDNYILPVSAGQETTNLYGSSYLLQSVPVPDSTSDQTVVKEDEFNDTEPRLEMDVASVVHKSTDECTEVTLTDEQCKMLEEKGWVLLETNNKIFVLNTVGLHDITMNQELIEQYRKECETSLASATEETPSLKGESPAIKAETATAQSSACDQNQMEIVIENAAANDEKIATEVPLELQKKATTLDDKTDESNITNLKVEDKPTPAEVQPIATLGAATTPKPETRRNILRLKTKYLFKNIPDKMVLGKTAGGKNLVAKVVKRSNNKAVTDSTPPDTTGAGASQIDNTAGWCWYRELLRHSSTPPDALAVNSAGAVLGQLLLMPAFRPAIAGRHVVVTKMKSNQRHVSSVVTGSVQPTEEGGWRLVHKPDLLQRLHEELNHLMANEDAEKKASERLEDFSVLHVNVTEKQDKDLDSVSITLSKRQIPYNPPASSKRKKLFACSSCARIFDTDHDLIVHQEMHCLDDELTIDTCKLNYNTTTEKQYCVLKSDKGIQYACLLCNMKFKRIGNCQRHVKTHQPPEANKDVGENGAKEAMYQCQLCACAYSYPSTLAKHFNSVHLKANVISIENKVSNENKNVSNRPEDVSI